MPSSTTILLPSKHSFSLHGYQLYAVDRWLLNRRVFPLLIVYTGDPAHKIDVGPVEVDEPTYQLIQQHAKPKHTQHGTLMLTSLAHFRSDYTIVLVPGGDLDAATQQLYTNINLLRMGCAGRSGLTLEEPSDATKDRFISMYLLPQGSFNDTVLELVRLIQASLYLFGYYSQPIDGLLCDFTLDGLSSWFKHVGRSYLDPVDRCTDPSVLSLLFSLVLAVRNCLAAISPHRSVPKDPFLYPRSFTRALATHFTGSTPSTSSNASFIPVFLKDHTHSLPVIPSTPPQSSPVQPTLSQPPTLSVTLPTPPGSALHTPAISDQDDFFLSPAHISSVFSSYENKRDRKARNNGSIDDISHLPLPHPHVHLPSALISNVGGIAGILTPISDLKDFVGVVIGRKEASARTKQRQSEERSRTVDSNPSDSSASDDGLGVDISKAAAKVKARVRKSRDGYEKKYASYKGKDSDLTGVGGTLRGLWTGRVSAVVHLRLWAEQRQITRQSSLDNDKEEGPALRSEGFGSWRTQHSHTKKSISLGKSKGGLWSDGDNTDSPSTSGKRTSMPVIATEALKPTFSRRGSVAGGRSRYGSVNSFGTHGEKSDGRSTEEEGGGAETFGALWAKGGSKVRDKLESWTGLSMIDGKRRNKTNSEACTPSNNSTANVVDLSPVPSPLASPSLPSVKSPNSSPSTRKKPPGVKLLLSPSPSVSASYPQPISQPQSPIGGTVYGGYGDDDDDLLSSGQVSPVGYGGASNSVFIFGTKDRDGVGSGGDDPRTPKAWGHSTSKLGSPFSSPHPSMSGLLSAQSRSKSRKRGSDTSASANDSAVPSNQSHIRIQVEGPEGTESAVAVYAKKVSDVLGRGHPTKRPWPGNRIPYGGRVSSWSDPVSARGQDKNGGESDDEDGDRLSREEEEAEPKGKSVDVLGEAMPPLSRRWDDTAVRDQVKEGPRRQSAFSPTGWIHYSEEPTDYFDSTPTAEAIRMARSKSSREEDGDVKHKALGSSLRRRWSFHALSFYRTDADDLDFNEHGFKKNLKTTIKVLPVDRMRIDVELCAQYLVMWRREEHLKNVAATLQILTSRLSDTNIHLREHYDSHLSELAELESRVKVIAEVDTEDANANKISQATNTLWYEAEQFRVPDLWHTASPPRAKVLAMREKIFGTGGRRFPQGVHGAHGRFNRLQWTLDGQERLVDMEGKTESEVEEEERIDLKGELISPPEEDEDVVEHPSIKPMWLLRFFTSWGRNWGAPTSTTDAVKVDGKSPSPTDVSPRGESRSSLDDSAASSLSPSSNIEATKLGKAASL